MVSSDVKKIYVFGDQTFNYEQSLAQLLRSDNIHLSSFFQKCYKALRKELGRLPIHARDPTPKFCGIADLLTRKRDGCLSSALEQVLCLIHCVAAFIW
jgi:naphtho-gamma-pyrone polyketide synthase